MKISDATGAIVDVIQVAHPSDSITVTSFLGISGKQVFIVSLLNLDAQEVNFLKLNANDMYS